MNNLEKIGAQFLHKKENKLHTSHKVEHEFQRKKRKEEEISQKPDNKIADWLKILERTHFGHKDDPRALERIKKHYHKENINITLEDIPQSYWNNQARIMIEQGYGGDMENMGVEKEKVIDKKNQEHINYSFPEEKQNQELEIILNNQKKSLDNWIDYLSSEDAVYSMWAKYWAFKSVLKMGKLKKTEMPDGNIKADFQKRDKSTTASFPLLNPRALAKTIGVLSNQIEENQKPKKERENIENESKRLNDEEFQRLLSTEKFAKIYAQFLVEMPEYSTEGLEETRGVWKKFNQGEDPSELIKSLEGYPLEWCTADYDTAKTQLEGGDFYVYYSINEDGEAVIPRLAIRMEGENKIAEPPRGIAPNQNIDPFISPVLEEKMQDFGEEGEKYQKRAGDMKRLTEICNRKEELSREDLKFLYEFDDKIEGFGYKDDPRIEELLEGRDIKKDLAEVTGFSENEIGTTKEEALRGGIKFHYGDLDLSSLQSAEGLQLPETINGYLDLESLESAEGLELPKTINGGLYLRGLKSAEGLNLPETIKGDLDLRSLQSAKGLELPKTINGGLYLRGLKSAEGLNLPETIKGDLDLRSLQSAKGLELPETIKGHLNLRSLQSAEGLQLPETIKGDLDLGSLQSAEGLELPETINGSLYLYSLESAEGLQLPETIKGGLYLNSLQSAEGLQLPETIKGNLYLNNLQSAEGLQLPETIKGGLYLSGLKSAEGLELPETINGDLDLGSLQSAEGLQLPETIRGNLYLNNLQSAEGLELPETINGSLYLNNLQSTEKEELRRKYSNIKIT